MLPHDLLPKSTVYDYFTQWRDDGTWAAIVSALREQLRREQACSGESTPSAASIDSQSVKTAGSGGEGGFDGAKKITGRKRPIAVDTLGLLLAVVVTAASVDDAAAAPEVLAQLDAACLPRLEIVWADSKYHNHKLNRWIKAQSPQWHLEIVRRPGGSNGFVLLPKRWVVERTFGWLMRCRRLGREHERRTDSSEAMVQIASIQVQIASIQVQIASIHLMLKRLKPSNVYPPFRYRVAA